MNFTCSKRPYWISWRWIKSHQTKYPCNQEQNVLGVRVNYVKRLLTWCEQHCCRLANPGMPLWLVTYLVWRTLLLIFPFPYPSHWTNSLVLYILWFNRHQNYILNLSPKANCFSIMCVKTCSQNQFIKCLSSPNMGKGQHDGPLPYQWSWRVGVDLFAEIH